MPFAPSFGPNHSHTCTFDGWDGTRVEGYRWLNPDKTLGGWVAATAVVDESATIDPSAMVCSQATINAGVVLEDGSYVGDHVEIPARQVVPRNTQINLRSDGYYEVCRLGNKRINRADDHAMEIGVPKAFMTRRVAPAELADLLARPSQLTTLSLED